MECPKTELKDHNICFEYCNPTEISKMTMNHLAIIVELILQKVDRFNSISHHGP